MGPLIYDITSMKFEVMRPMCLAGGSHACAEPQHVLGGDDLGQVQRAVPAHAGCLPHAGGVVAPLMPCQRLNRMHRRLLRAELVDGLGAVRLAGAQDARRERRLVRRVRIVLRLQAEAAELRHGLQHGEAAMSQCALQTTSPLPLYEPLRKPPV